MKFSDIPSHESVKERLRALVDNDRLPHALLLHGRPGVGKMMMARALAQYIHCSDRQGGDSCGRCPACLQHASFNHVDTHFSFPVVKRKGKTTTTSDDWIEEWREFLTENPYCDFKEWLQKLDNINGQPRIYVEESAELLRKLSFTSRTGRQLVLMWLPERMGVEAANKMLKLIEEPLGDTMFILVSNDAEGILPTIMSRLQRIEMLRLPDDVVARYLVENHNIAATQAHSVAHLADGSIIDATYRVNNYARQEQYLELFMRLMRLAYQKKVGDLKAWSIEVASLGREGAVDFLTYCIEQIRENFIYHLHECNLTFMTVDEEKFARNFHRFINERNVLELTQRFENSIKDIQANANAKIELFDLAVRVIILLLK